MCVLSLSVGVGQIADRVGKVQDRVGHGSQTIPDRVCLAIGSVLRGGTVG